uniref:Uncharacterized protein n=1 Tax=viral metagenome TaxID=1070528 RepID=A0A6C0EQB3_9ZZZZ
MENDNSILNDDWINNFEKNDKLYKDFYKDDLYYTNINFIYLNKANEIEKIKNESFIMSKVNSITREEIIRILKNHSFDNGIRYGLLSILRYNITIESERVVNFLNEKDISLYNEQFLVPINNIDEIVFEKTIHMFHDLNDIIIIFYEKNNNTSSHNNTTKRVFLSTSSSRKKTLKKTI